MDRDERERIVGDIYEAAILPERWTDVIETISERFGFCGGAIVTSAGNWTITPSIEDIFRKFAAAGWLERNERLIRLCAAGAESFVGDFDLFTLDEWRTLPIYRDFLVPHGHGYGAGTLVRGPSDDQTVFLLERKFEKGPTDAGSLAALNALRPHIARAFALSMEAQKKRMQDLLAGLDLVRAAAAIITHSGRILSANSEFERLDPQVSVGPRDRLVLPDKSAQMLVWQAIHGSEGASVQSVPVPTLGERDAFVLHVIPLRKAARDLSPLGAAILLASRAMGSAQAEAGVILRGLYDLTRGEARAALGILEGRSPREIAQEAGISVETVRSVLKSVFAKTGAAGQVDLVRRLSMLAR